MLKREGFDFEKFAKKAMQDTVTSRELFERMPTRPALAEPEVAAHKVRSCVEINQCVGCTQFFTKSFLGDDAAVLVRSSGEEPASPRHRAGVAAMAWRTTRRSSPNAP